MQKQKKQFMILCVILAACIAAFFGMKAVTKHQEEKKAAQEEAEKIIAATVETSDISEFSYQYEGEEITFTKEEDVWYANSDKSISISQTMISTMLSNLAEITAAQQITDAEDISQYGFEEPLNVIELKLAEKELTITIGMYNDMTGQYYLMVSDSDNVYLVDSTIYSAFQKSVEDLTEVTEGESTDETEEE